MDDGSTIVELDATDVEEVTVLWAEAGLTRPWNDPAADFRRALEGTTSAVLGVRQGEELTGSVMVGHDGHRGWVYYLAVRTSRQRTGVGRELMKAAEQWLRERGAVKVQLMVRSDNDAAMAFYDRLGFEGNDVKVLSRWIKE
jgi:ribosomal protein S18 acetylase RimI-like enzyme